MQDGQNMYKFPKAILFDWDDCLVTQGNLIAEVTDFTLKKFLNAADYQRHKSEEIISGQSMKRVFPRIFGEARWQEIKAAYYDRFQTQHLEALEYMPGAQETLEYCQNQLEFLGLVSNKKGDFLRKEVNFLALEHLFQAIIGAEDASDDKPSRAPVDLALSQFKPFQHIMEQQTSYGDELWFVGDRLTDLQTAQAAGCVGVYIGPKDPSTFNPAPDLHFKSLLALKTYLASLKCLESFSADRYKSIDTFGDMSPRHYTRLQSTKDQTTIMLMDAHLQPNSLEPFLDIQSHLQALGYSYQKS